MKDRIVFFILGALLATFAYLAGCINTNRLKEVPFLLEGNVEITGKLLVREAIVVGKTDEIPMNMIYISTVDKGSNIVLHHGYDKKKNQAQSTAHITAHKYPDGRPMAAIELIDIFGNEALGVNNLGWSKEKATEQQ